MNRIIIAAALAASAAPAMADEWTGPDKQLHFAVGTMAAVFATASLSMLFRAGQWWADRPWRQKGGAA